ncbi:MAG: DNA helicase-2/ATP-dependent DNA helicase PcrA [Rickettsiales bacterium]|jgi:DNA helicase-2/ATP-dependent DNA helicase PcrA
MTLDLNKTQKEAVLHQNSPLLILAGAGTGKTRVLTERIVYLINSYLANPYQILAVTFTNKAASEMKHRIYEQIGDLANNIWMGTFHGIAVRILKRHPEIVGLKPDFTIIDSDDSLRLIKQITADFNIDSKEFPPKSYQYQIERLKDKAFLPSDFREAEIDSPRTSSTSNLPKFDEVYNRYQTRLQDLNCADFGDLLLYNLRIFAKSPETLQYYQNKFQQILVDEYQDTNACQYQWLLKLAGSVCASDSECGAKKRNQNICAVGDDDQSIYSWRGAEIANILRFEKDFPNTKIIRLEQNYRSTSNILAAASHLIKHNQDRHQKTLWTENKDGPQEKIKLLTFLSDRMEAAGIADIIFDLQRNKGINLSQIAILVRAGYQTRSFEEAFMSSGLPYRIVGGLKFYDRREIKDSIAYLRLLHNSADDLAFERIINVPRRGLGQAGLEKLMNKARNEKCSLFLAVKRAVQDGELKGKSKMALEELINNLEKWQSQITTLSLSDLTKTVIEGVGYIQMWQNEKTPDAGARVENLQEFAGGLTEFESLAGFLDHVSLVSGNEKIQDDTPTVGVMTVHSAKGLEFDAVFIPGLEEGVFPSGRALNERNGMEEERRLLYVAITRARKILHLSFAQSRFVFGQMQNSIPSPFLKELPEEIINADQLFENVGFNERSFVPQQKVKHYDLGTGKNKEESFQGKRVFHQKFGYGKVLGVDGEKLKIKFEKSDVKTVMKGFVNINN